MRVVTAGPWILFPVLLAVSGCEVNLSVPDGAMILCATTDECPDAMVCVETLGRCVRADDPDRLGPALVDASVQPAVAKAGTAVRLTVTFDEPLARPPVVEATGPAQAGALNLTTASGEGSTYTALFVVDETTTEGEWTFTASALDTRGNPSTLEVGRITVDRTAPAVTGLAFDVASAAATALVHLSADFDEDVTLEAVSLLDAKNELRATLDTDDALTSLPQGGARLALALALETFALSHGDALTVELTARDQAGNLTVARSPALLIDDEAPVVTAFTTSDGQIVGQREITLVIGGVGATQMRLAGDVLPTAQTFGWVPFATSATVTLTAGGAEKSLSLTLRDEAGNDSAETTLVLTVLDGPTLSEPLLSAPAGQSAVKNGDLLTIGGAGDAGASIVSAHVVRVSDGQVIQTLGAGEVVIDDTGALSGRFVLTGAAHGELVAVEVVLTVRGRASLPAASRSPALAVDLLPPAPVDPTKVVLVEREAALVAPGVEDAFHRFELEALDGATVDARQVLVYGDLAQAPVATAQVTAGGGFETLEVPFVAAQRYHLTTIDHAGNESAATTVTVPRATGVVVTPRPVRAGSPVKVVFTTNLRLRARPEVTVDGRAATYLSGDRDKVGGDTFTFQYTPSGDEREGPDAALVLIHLAPSTSLLASPSVGFDAAHASFDFTPPTFGALQLQQNPPGSADRIVGAAISDSAGGVVLPLTAWPVALEALGEDGEIYGTATAQPDGSFSVDVGDNTADGFRLRARDAAGNETVSALLRNDRTPPVLLSLTVEPPAQRSGEPVSVTLRLRDDLETPPPALTLPGGAASLVDASVENDELVFAYSYTPTQEVDPEGANTIEVHAVDPGGNVATAQSSVRFDFTPPTSAPTTPGGQAVWNGHPSILGRASDEATGVSQVLLSVRDSDSGQWFDGADFDSSEEVLLPAVGTTAFSTDGIGFVDGHTYELNTRAVDGAGNVQSQPGVATFTFDADSLDGPVEPEAHSIGSGNVLVRWQAPASTTVVSYRVYYADAAYPGPPWSDEGALEGPSPVTTTDTSLLLTGLPPGRYGIVVTAMHEGGVESAFSATVEADANVWHWRNPPLTSVGLSAVVAVDDETFVAVGGGGLILRSTDAGASWKFVESGVTGALKSLWSRGPILVAAHTGGLLRSSDAGVTWTSVGPEDWFFDVVSGSNEPCPQAPEPCVFHAITQSKIHRSVDGGLTWTSKTTSMDLRAISASGSRVIVGEFGRRVLISGDEGETFATKTALSSNHILNLVYTDGDRWFATGLNPQAASHEMRYSSDGSSWTNSASLGSSHAVLDILQVDDSLMIVTAGGIYQSTNGGVSFTRRLNASRQAALCRGQEATISVGQNLYRSTDLTTWTQTDPEINAGLSSCVAAGGAVIALGNASVWRSVDDGASWSRIQSVTSHELRVVHRSGQRAFAAGMAGRAFSSGDGGRTWYPESLGTSPLTAFAADGDTWVVAGGSGQIYRSGDAGVTWSQATGTGTLGYNQVFGRDGTFIATNDEEIRRSPDGGRTWKRVRSTLWPVVSLWGNGGTWVAAGDNLLLISEDDGLTWTNADGETNLSFRSVSGYGDTLIASAEGGHVKYRLDASSGWQAASVQRQPGYTDPNFSLADLSVVGWHTTDGVAWVGVSSNGVVRTTNLVEGFIARGGPVSATPHHLPVAIAGNAEYVIITTPSGLRYSRDLGVTWESGPEAIPVGMGRVSGLWMGADGKALVVGPSSAIISLDLP